MANVEKFPWIKHHLGGSVHKRRNGYLFTCQKDRIKFPNQTFTLKEYGSLDLALKIAKVYRIKFNEKHEVSLNDYRFLPNDLIEMKCRGYKVSLFYFLVADLITVLKYIWYAKKCSKSNNIYIATSTRNAKTGKREYPKLHSLLFGIPYKNLSLEIRVDHIDGRGWNNMSSNLRIASHQKNNNNTKMRANNTSGVNGVTLFKGPNGYRGFRASWRVEGKVFSRIYSYGKNRTKTEARRLAKNRRKEADLISGCTNGCRSKTVDIIIKPFVDENGMIIKYEEEKINLKEEENESDQKEEEKEPLKERLEIENIRSTSTNNYPVNVFGSLIKKIRDQFSFSMYD